MTTSECFECAGPADQAHHVVPRSKGGTKTVWLCVKCHGKVHGRKMAHNELTKHAMKEKKMRGERVGSVPHGFDCVDGLLVESEAQQEAIKIAKKLRGYGFTYRAIGDALWSIGHANKAGREFNHATVFKMCAGVHRPSRINRGSVNDYL